MPTFDDPTADAAEASAALRGLAHATRSFGDPSATYTVIGDLLAGVRSLHQVLDQLATAHLTHQTHAHDDSGDHHTGVRDASAAADELRQVAAFVAGAEQRVNRASQASGRIAWHPEPAAERRWVSVVFLQGDEADPVLEMIDGDGTGAAIDHLSQWDHGEETTQAALENGYVYDTPPTGQWDRTATTGEYTLTYDYLHGHVSLLRAHTPSREPNKPASERESTIGTGQGFSQRRSPVSAGGIAARRDPSSAPFAPLARRSSAPSQGRGLGL